MESEAIRPCETKEKQARKDGQEPSPAAFNTQRSGRRMTQKTNKGEPHKRGKPTECAVKGIEFTEEKGGRCDQRC